jgi:hypothetical protein
MLNPRAVSMALSLALIGLLSAPVGAAPKKRTNIIKVLEATYGGNCTGVATGNATSFVAAACADNDLCNYRVYYKQLGGDPAPDCEKDFKVTYTCGRSNKPSTCELAAEAGKGGEEGYPNQFCLLHCLSTGSASDDVAKPAPARARDPAPLPISPGSRPVYPYSADRRPYSADGFSGFWR